MTSSSKSALFSPITLRGVTFKNRIGVAPMCMYSAEDGLANDFHLVNAGSFALGGAGMVMLEAAAVEPRGRITHNCIGIWKDEHVEKFAPIVQFIRGQGAVPGIQIAHAGAKASSEPPWLSRGSIADEDGGWPTIAASAIAFGGGHVKVPKEATLEDINKIKEAFITGFKRAVKAGFKLIEIHFAHGYLINTFLSPVTNKRTDKYGGSLENRMRLPLEIIEGIKKIRPDNVVLAVRISVTDYCENGWDMDQTMELAKRLKALGVDILDCSSGGVALDSVPKTSPLDSSTVQHDAAKKVQKEVGLRTAAVGMIKDPLEAEKILTENGATFILLGRMFLNNPHWPFYAADLLDGGQSFKYPNQYDWCIGWKGFGKWRKLLPENSQK